MKALAVREILYLHMDLVVAFMLLIILQIKKLKLDINHLS